MKADYAAAAARVKSELKDSWLAAVDATQQPTLQKQHEVRGFPTLKLFRKGKFVADYNKPRKTEDLVAFMTTPPTGSKDEL
jgi:thioredoxin-like negative regulator of GroEL